MLTLGEKTFGQRSSRDMLGKLERELERLASSTKRDDIVDHGINVALTAWHLTEWVWPDTAHTRGLRDRLAAEAGVSAASFDDREFKRYAIKACPELRYCRIIATTAKHLECRGSYPDDPSFVTGVGLGEITWVNDRGEPITFVNAKGEPIRWTSAASDLVIVDDDGTHRRAADVFDRVRNWWIRFIYSNRVDEKQDPLPDLPPPARP